MPRDTQPSGPTGDERSRARRSRASRRSPMLPGARSRAAPPRATPVPGHRPARPPRPPTAAGYRPVGALPAPESCPRSGPTVPARPATRTRPPKLIRRQPPRQLQQRQRVAARLSHDPLPHSVIQRNTQHRAQQSARITITQTLHHQPRQPLELFARLTRRQHQRDRLRQQPPRHEHKRLRSGQIKPLRVIDTHTRAASPRPPPPTGSAPPTPPRTDPARSPLAARTPPPAPPAEAPAAGPGDPASARTTAATPRTRAPSLTPHRPPARPGTPAQTRSQTAVAPLTDPGFAAHHQHPALPTPHRLKQLIQHLALDSPAVQHLSWPLGDHAKPTISRPNAAVDTPPVAGRRWPAVLPPATTRSQGADHAFRDALTAHRCDCRSPLTEGAT